MIQIVSITALRTSHGSFDFEEQKGTREFSIQQNLDTSIQCTKGRKHKLCLFLSDEPSLQLKFVDLPSSWA